MFIFKKKVSNYLSAISVGGSDFRIEKVKANYDKQVNEALTRSSSSLGDLMFYM